MREQSRISSEHLIEQANKRKNLQDSPSEAGGLPAVNERIAQIQEILAIHAPESAQPV